MLPSTTDTTEMRRMAPGLRRWIWMPALAGMLASCAAPKNELFVVDHLPSGIAEHYRETFNEACFDIDTEGNVNVVLRQEQPFPDDPGRTLLQVVHVRSFWKPIPGVTVAHDRQINAVVRYAVYDGRSGACFEGAGSAFFRDTRDGRTLVGELGLVCLSPKARLNEGRTVFERAELSGRFTALRDPRRVTRWRNELEGWFALDDRNALSLAAP
ncbi:MAG: hypothetical protein HS102_04410 [Planctomycetia bacterium]|nr:MAG: hypothetical protein EDS66_05970 [Planctomycetota bacterium]MBE7455858.1 hypothetical protein [Planctomycetia bacterium]MCQ3919609.1 hypothetical protein [Planctomycetota bacterium]